MKQKGIVAALILTLILVTFIGTSIAYSQTAAVISSYTVNSEDGGDVTGNALMSGATYTISLEVTLDTTLPGTELSVSTPLEKVEDVYWHLENDYAGINTSLWQPGQDTIEFDAVEGVALFTVVGTIPSTYTTQELPNEDMLHFTKDISLITLSLTTGGDPLDVISVEVQDETIVAYQNKLDDINNLLLLTGADPTYTILARDIITLAGQLSEKGYVEGASSLLGTLPIDAADFPSMEDFEAAVIEKTSLVESVDTDPTYAALVEDVIDLAQDLNDSGYVNNAMDSLNVLPDSASDFPDPIANSSTVSYLVVIIMLALILIVSFLLFLKARAGNSFIQHQVEEEAGNLDVLLVRISKIDRQLANDIEQVKEQLERISGR